MKVSAIQFCGRPGDVRGNRDAAAAYIRSAAEAGARVIVLPELIVPGYTARPEILADGKEPLHGPTYESWHALAASLDVVIAGGFCEEEDGKLFNTAICVGPNGLLLHYRKLHLFDSEKAVFTPGDKGLPIVATDRGRLGLCVCYDLRFVEVVRALALRGAEIVLVPTAWVGGFDVGAKPDAMIGQAQGAVVQANLSQVFMACASQSGSTSEARFLGSSMIVSPYGTILSGPLDCEREGVVSAEIDLGDVLNAQNRSPTIQPRADRRVDVYGLAVGSEVL